MHATNTAVTPNSHQIAVVARNIPYVKSNSSCCAIDSEMIKCLFFYYVIPTS